MKQKQLLFLLAMLMTAATGAWAQSATTHVVTQATLNTIFSGTGYTLGEAVAAGDVLDFQGTIDIDHSLVINKPVNIISSSNPNAVVKLNSASNTESPVNGDPGRAFVINKAGSGTTVNGIRLENTQTWLFNTSNVTFTGVTMWVEEADFGRGLGQVSIRYSDHVTFDGCTVYAKNNGGNSGCVLTGSHDCTFRNSRFEKEGNVANILYIGNPYNVDDKPADYTMNADNISVINCTITAESSGFISQYKIMGGVRHHIENCTVNYYTSFSSTVTKPEDGYVIRNNTFITPASVTFPNYSTVEGNTITVNATGSPYVTFNQGTTATNNTITVTTTGTAKVTVKKGTTLTGNTINNNVEVSSNSSDYVGSTITGNAINGTVTFASNSKNNTLTRNVITSTGDYAVVMASTADANNTVQYNTLIAATKKGDEAVNLSNSSGNTISNNSNIALMLADGTKDAANWSATVNGEQPNPLPVAGLSKGDAVTLKYNGRLKVKSVTATTDPEPDPLATPLTIEALTAGTIQVNITDGYDPATLETGMKYSKDGGTTKTLITQSEDIPVAKGDKVQFYGNGKETQVYGGDAVVSIQGSGDGFQTKVYGNIMSLLDETGFATKTDLPNADLVFFGLFRGNATLIDASELLLPAATLTKACYQQMFDGCTSLTKAPKLPATQLADGCYAYMFNDCQLLTAAPKLPATELAIGCYYAMFSGCESLTTAYVKAAYIDEINECFSMFDSCWATGAVLHTTSDNKASWENMMGSGTNWDNWSVAADWQD